MWNKKRSILLSRLCVFIFTALVLTGMAAGYYIVEWFIALNAPEMGGTNALLMLTCYSGGLFILIILFNLNTILKNIWQDKVFIKQNTDAIRIASWSCIAIGIICLISVIYYFPFLIVSMASAFMGLILRIIKNIIEKAIEMKEENEYTI